MSLDVLKTKIKENNISGVYLFCGPEEYTKDHYAGLIRKKVDASPLPEFNHIYFDASSSRISELEDAVYSLPYMWDQKLIEIINLESAKITEADASDYARIFEDVPDYLTILAVLRSDEQIEETRKSKTAKGGLAGFSKAVSDNGLVIEFEFERSDKLANWIVKHFNAKGVRFDMSVPREMLNVCGSDMYVLQSEINKLVEVYNGSPITLSDVRKYCCANVAYKYFDIANALNRRDIVGAKRVWDSLDLGRDEISMALGFLAKNYSEMMIVKTGIESGKNPDHIAKDTKIPSWRISKIAQSVGNTNIKFLSFAVNQLTTADLKLKSFRGNPHRILELAFYRICTYGREN